MTRVLIAALGGEGGGVLTTWIVRAANAEGLPVQATSVPGVAQRTGATTYYIEMTDGAQAGVPDPVFALMPVAGDVDVVIASELLEAARMTERGFVTPDRTFLLASTHRMLTMSEKIARGDGSLDHAALERIAERGSSRRLLFDAAATARDCGGAMNAVLLGALAGAGLLPIPAGRLRESIETAGVNVAGNLAGFAAGLAIAGGAPEQTGPASGPASGAASGAPALAPALAERITALGEPARAAAALGAARLVDYQDERYARLYLDRLAPFGADPQLQQVLARHLAVRMSFEDVIRVAQLKTRPSRLARIRAEVGASGDEPFEIVDFFKPGIDELADTLPAGAGRMVRRWAERRGIAGRAHLGMRVRTTTILGFGRIWLLARLRTWRPRTLRFAEEQEAIEQWLELVTRARRVSPELALETAELARIVKGYGETYRRGQETYQQLVREHVLPALQTGATAAPGGPGLRAALETALRAA